MTNRRTLGNFEYLSGWISKRPDPPLLIAATLLVPGYVDAEQVSRLAHFIARLDPSIPYALLGFHAAFEMCDLPTTSRQQAAECLVAAGEMVMSEVRRNNVNLIPVDSEHSAIRQCLMGERPGAVKRIILTASGGPLINVPAGELAKVKVSEALKHPTWNMGRKVTIDSATLLNKGFEVIEAQWLFGLETDNIEVVVERKSLVHALVEFVDGVMIGLLSSPDMRLPIQYALTFPERVDTSPSRLNLESIGQITFEKPDRQRFPCLGLAYEASRVGGTAPAVLSAADEVAVDAFLRGDLAFGDIYPMLRDILARHVPMAADDIQPILEADRWAREQAQSEVRDISGRA